MRESQALVAVQCDGKCCFYCFGFILKPFCSVPNLSLGKNEIKGRERAIPISSKMVIKGKKSFPFHLLPLPCTLALKGFHPPQKNALYFGVYFSGFSFIFHSWLWGGIIFGGRGASKPTPRGSGCKWGAQTPSTAFSPFMTCMRLPAVRL